MFFTSPKLLKKENSVTLNHWTVSREDRAGHVAVKIIQKGNPYYFAVWADRSPDFREQQQDSDAPEAKMLIIDNEEDDYFIMGFREATYAQYKEEKTKDSVTVPTDVPSILKHKKQMDPREVRKLIELGKPDNQITLYTLKTQQMIDYVDRLKQQELRWEFWMGTKHPQEGYAQCSSTVIRALIAGGIDKLVENWASYLRKRAFVASIVLAPFFYPSWTMMLTTILTSTFMGGALGGAIDIQPLSNALNSVLNVNDRGDWHATKFFISLVPTVSSAITSAFGFDELNRQYFVLPRDVLHFAQRASEAEEQNSVLSPSDSVQIRLTN